VLWKRKRGGILAEEKISGEREKNETSFNRGEAPWFV